MTIRNTASFQIARRFAALAKLRRDLAFKILSQQGGENVVVPFDLLFSAEDANALEEFERFEKNLE